MHPNLQIIEDRAREVLRLLNGKTDDSLVEQAVRRVCEPVGLMFFAWRVKQRVELAQQHIARRKPRMCRREFGVTPSTE